MSNRLDVVVGAVRGGRRRKKASVCVCACMPLLPADEGGGWRNSADAICINEPPPDNGARSMNYVPRGSNETRIAFDSSLARVARPPLPSPPRHTLLRLLGSSAWWRCCVSRAAMAGKPSFLSGFGSTFDGIFDQYGILRFPFFLPFFFFNFRSVSLPPAGKF